MTCRLGTAAGAGTHKLPFSPSPNKHEGSEFGLFIIPFFAPVFYSVSSKKGDLKKEKEERVKRPKHYACLCI